MVSCCIYGFILPLIISFVLTGVTKGGKTNTYLAAVTTYYFRNPEEALKRAKAAGKRPGYWYGGITLPSGKKGWAIYKGGRVIEQYAVM